MFHKNDKEPVEPLRYRNAEDTRMRLDHTILRYRGNPYYCRWRDGTNVRLISLEQLPNRTTDRDDTFVDANDPELDISSIPLGYVNTTTEVRVRSNFRTLETACFMARAPFRQQTQGIHERNCRGIFEDGTGHEGILSVSFSSLGWLNVKNTICRKYPTAEDAWQRVREGRAQAVAFHPHLAFSWLRTPERDGTHRNIVVRLRLNGHTVGYVSDNDGVARVCLSIGYDFLGDFLSKIKGIEV